VSEDWWSAQRKLVLDNQRAPETTRASRPETRRKKTPDSACRHTLGGPTEDFCSSRICRVYQVRFKSLFAALIAVVLRIGEAGEAAAAPPG